MFVKWRYIFKDEHTDVYYGNRINRYIPLLSILLKSLSIIVPKYYNKERVKKQNKNKVYFYVQHFKYLIKNENKDILTEDLIRYFAYKSMIPNNDCEKEVSYVRELKVNNLPEPIKKNSRFDLKNQKIAIEFKYHVKLKTSSSATTSNCNSAFIDIRRLSHLAAIGYDCYLFYVYGDEMRRYYIKKRTTKLDDNVLRNAIIYDYHLSNELYLMIIRISGDNSTKYLNIVY